MSREIITGLLMLAGAVIWLSLDAINYHFDQRQAEAIKAHKMRADKAEALLLPALNGGAIMINGKTAVFFDKAKEVKL